MNNYITLLLFEKNNNFIFFFFLISRVAFAQADGYGTSYNFLTGPFKRGHTDIFIALNQFKNTFGEIGLSRGFRGNDL